MQEITLQMIYDLLTTHKESRNDVPLRSQNLDQLFTALSAAQAEFEVPKLNRVNQHKAKIFADIGSVVRATVKPLTTNGLAVIQELQTGSDGQLTLHTLLTHKSGQYVESRMRITPSNNSIDTLSSYVTYMKRLAYCSLVGLAVPEEDDNAYTASLENEQEMLIGKERPRAIDRSYEVIDERQLDMLLFELEGMEDLVNQIKETLQLRSLADLPRSEFEKTLEKVRVLRMRRKQK